MKVALLVVDAQLDFMETGALPVPHGSEIIPVINEVAKQLYQPVIVTSQDWHPKNHCSFQANGGQWPSHCIQNSAGASLSPDLKLPNSIAVYKGTDPDKEAYSAFDGSTENGESLDVVLQRNHVTHVYICGLALDYCVAATVKDAVRLGYKTSLIVNATRAITKEGKENTLNELAKLGVQFYWHYSESSPKKSDTL